MKRFHVHVSVDKLEDSIRFYSAVFGAEPSVLQSDYAKWMLEDPQVNFAISSRGRKPGINHVGFQVSSGEELAELKARLAAADRQIVEQQGVACCYARSDKYWVTDPSGIAWESFHSLGTVPVYGADPAPEGKACCPSAVAAHRTSASASCC